eukprot:3169272-Amphidinium_carterae.1
MPCLNFNQFYVTFEGSQKLDEAKKLTAWLQGGASEKGTMFCKFALNAARLQVGSMSMLEIALGVVIKCEESEES